MLVLFRPHPPRPPSQREGGDFLFSYARGSAPCIPGAEPGRHWLFSAVSVLSVPIPPTPFPRGEGGDFLFSYARGGAPCIPGAKPGRHWLFLPYQCFPVPIPPTPFPAGRGRFFALFCRGLAPPAPLLLNPRGAGLPGGSAPAPLWLSPRGTDIPSGRNHLNIIGSTLVNAYL